jgi:hypothetical protein
LGEAWQDRTSKPGSGDEVLPPFRVGAGWRFLVWVRRTEVKSTTKHAAGCFRCMLELLCLAWASYTSLRHTPTVSHLTSLHTNRLHLTRPHLHPPLNPFQSLSRRYRYPPSALARLIASDLASRRCGARETPSFTWESLSGEQRPYLGYHHTRTLNSPLPTYEWPAPPFPLEHEVVIRVPKVA